MQPEYLIYCEAGANPRELRRWLGTLPVKIVHFPYDSRCHAIPAQPVPSAAQIRDLNLPIGELPGVLSDYSPSPHFEKILAIVGRENRRDALHIDSAFKSGCVAFVTTDSDFLAHAEQLELLLGVRIVRSSDEGLKEIVCFVGDKLRAAT
jgi:hypothetical protein